MEAFERAKAIRDANFEKRKEEKRLKEEEERKIIEEKLVKKAIAVKKKQIKKQAVLDEISDDDTPIQKVKEIAKTTKRSPVLEKKDFRILFVGNSFTFYNDGIDYHLQNMLRLEKSTDTINYITQKVAVSSYTLEAHYQDPVTMDKIKNSRWNLVVLQEQSTRPVNNPGLFLEFATKLDSEIKKTNSGVALFMTWAPEDTPSDLNLIAASYNSVGAALKDIVVPVGKVWEYFRKNNSNIDLYFSDRKHPSLAGTYLTACVFFNVVFKKNPVDNGYVPVGLSTEDSKTIKKIVSDYFIINQ